MYSLIWNFDFQMSNNITGTVVYIMKLYKYDTHMHTSQGSACSLWRGSAIVDRLSELGYSGCFITDHFFNGNSAVDRRLPWDVKIHLFCQGYEEAKKRGDEIGFQVFFGWEFAMNGTEFLTYGLDKQFLLDNPQIMEMPLDKYADFVHEKGGFIVHAHPFREAWYIPLVRLYPKSVDGIEVVNCGNAPEQNERAKWYANSYDLPMTGGTDAHHIWSYHSGGIALDEKLKDANDYLTRLRERRITQILEPSKDAHLPWPDNADSFAVRNSIDLLDDEMKQKAIKAYEEMKK